MNSSEIEIEYTKMKKDDEINSTVTEIYGFHATTFNANAKAALSHRDLDELSDSTFEDFEMDIPLECENINEIPQPSVPLVKKSELWVQRVEKIKKISKIKNRNTPACLLPRRSIGLFFPCVGDSEFHILEQIAKEKI